MLVLSNPLARQWAAPETIRLRILSLGAGVQSTTLALMAAQGEIGQMPDCAIFADTGWEPRAVYEHLAWLRSPNVLPFPVHIVSAGNIRAGILAAARGRRWASIPAYTRTRVDGRDEIGMIGRQCTTEHKLVPIRRKVRALAGLTRKRSPRHPVVEQWIGISFDELVRAKYSIEAWQINRWPLIEKAMTRRDCLRWLERHGYPRPPKSSCLGCPFHSDAAWREIRDHDPEGWADVVSVDQAMRRGLRGIRGEVFLHRSATPLKDAPLTDEEKTGQPDLFLDECDGMCGV
ncbi:hypothetical protein AA101099_2486 [Neoasaia chiangmaiensis NBRC 101099]|uniref:Uncharacterized protein n=1 Tax=Neoasaia chiangmaiensis TaxID=320497 RepID=A0A1U9KLL5_9PROT|nr:hypothetical protein [Neoasaia chiangmaiensis]AQS86668.1 hypothetical protein A0U93_00440 [Neoasaia chiangmaiensis]GBR41357.1 hypothetical protein AA101099_2486 [Neoasaia chiangmaiensis NBRC 101099]GEN16663.1 hypothetical protein NCH01_30940 [Neoasaia chiangmaiensis]